MFGLLRERVRRTPDAIAYRQYDSHAKHWTALTWQQVLRRTQKFAGALNELNLPPRQNVGILLKNCIDWVCFDMAAHQLGHVVVPLYPQDCPENAAHIVRNAELRLLFVDTASRWSELQAYSEHFPVLDHIWLQRQDTAINHVYDSLRIRSLDGVLSNTDLFDVDLSTGPDSQATIIYTSGTTGVPKGVVLTHYAILKNAEGVARVIPPAPDDVFLSILPLAHAFERTLGYYLPMMAGSSTAYAPSLQRLLSDLRNIKPTVVMGVPRLFEQMHSIIRRGAKGNRLKLWLLDTTAKLGWRRSQWLRGQARCPPPHERLLWPLLAAIVVTPVTGALGGRLRVAVSGGANLPTDIAEFLIGLGLPLVEGYGLTEAGPVVTASTLQDYVPGSVGFPISGVDLKVSDHGELLVCTSSKMTGYWRNSEASSKAFLDERWLRTGDLAELREGRVYIVGRCKDILVLSNGENVNPEALEAVIAVDPLIKQICLVGDRRPFLSAIVVIDMKLWLDLAHARQLAPSKPNTDLSKSVVLTRIAKRLKGRPTFQQVRAVHIELDEWTVESGLITPTLKVRRSFVLAKYKSQIEQIYKLRQ